jgi:hypothetical protein
MTNSDQDTAMKGIAWDKLTEKQASKFGVTLSIYHDAFDRYSKMDAVLFSKSTTLLMTVIIASTLTLWASAGVANKAIFVMMTLNTLVTLLSLRKLKRAVNDANKKVDDEIDQLPKS